MLAAHIGIVSQNKVPPLYMLREITAQLSGRAAPAALGPSFMCELGDFLGKRGRAVTSSIRQVGNGCGNHWHYGTVLLWHYYYIS